MGDTTINYEELGFGFHTFKKEICAELGEDFWNELVKNIELPDINTECRCQCQNMYLFMKRFEEMTDKETLKKILCKVRHGLHPSQCVGTHEKFMEIGDLDEYLGDGEDGVKEFAMLNREKRDFYGQEITDEVLEFIKQNPKMLTAVRRGNKLYTMAFPYNMKEYIKATDEKMKRYHACHCPFAKESILSEKVVSSALCNCSLGHMMNCYEGFMDRELKGRVIRSVLSGDMTCEYEIEIPDDIMQKYVVADRIISTNYFNYYKAFARSGIIDLHEGSVSWIIPRKGEKGPSLGFRVHLNEENAESELKVLTQGIRKGEVPQMWIVTPDATPDNIIDIMERNGFQNLSGEDDEPAMLLRKEDFRPYREENSRITCRKISAMEDFRSWIKDFFVDLAGRDMTDVKALFIPTAAIDAGAIAVLPKCMNDLLKCGISDENIRVYDMHEGMETEELRRYDVIYLCGGKTQYLLQRINDTGFGRSLREYIYADGVVLGVSAGSLIFANNIPGNLGLIDTKLDVHCGEGETRGKLSYPLKENVRLTNTCALAIRSFPDGLEIIGE